MKKFLKTYRTLLITGFLGLILSVGLAVSFYQLEITSHHNILLEKQSHVFVNEAEQLARYKRITFYESLGILAASIVIVIFLCLFISLREQREEKIKSLIGIKTKEITAMNQRLQSEVRQRQLTEKILAKKALEAQLMHKVTTNVSMSNTVSEALQLVVTTMCQITTWPVGHVYLLEKKENNTNLIPSGIWYVIDNNAYQDFIEITMKTTLQIGDDLPGRVLQTEQSCWIKNIGDDKNFQRVNKSKELNIKGAFAFPILVFGEIVAVLEFFHKEEIEGDAGFLKIIKSLGAQIGQILERKQVEEKMKEEKARLELFQNLAINREHEMINLKKQINELNRSLGKVPPYDLSFLLGEF